MNEVKRTSNAPFSFLEEAEIPQINMLMQDIERLEKECAQLREENEQLESIIAAFSNHLGNMEDFLNVEGQKEEAKEHQRPDSPQIEVETITHIISEFYPADDDSRMGVP